MVTGGGREAERDEEGEEEKEKEEKEKKEEEKDAEKSPPVPGGATGSAVPACPARWTTAPSMPCVAHSWDPLADCSSRYAPRERPALLLLDCCSHPAPRQRAVQGPAWAARGMLGVVVRKASRRAGEGAAGRAGLPARPAPSRCLLAVAAPSGSRGV